MLIHKLLFGDGAALYLPFALSRLRALEAINPDGFFSQTFIVDTATINVRQEGKFQYITITVGGGFYFEFASTGNPIKHVSFPSMASDIYEGLVVGVQVSAEKGSLKLKPTVLKQKRGQNSQVDYLYQIQLVHEPVRYRQLDAKARKKYFYPEIVYESYAPTHSHSGVGRTGSFIRWSTFTFGTDSGGQQTFNERDVSFDQPWGRSKGITPQTFGIVTDQADWLRASAVQLVTDDKYGTREFGIVGDASNGFHVFPISELGPLMGQQQNIDPTMLRHLWPSMPSGTYVPSEKHSTYWAVHNDLTEALDDMPEIDWKFRHDGKFACAVVYWREEFLFDSGYWAIDADPNTAFDSADFDRLRQRMNYNSQAFNGGYYGSTYKANRYFYGAGVIEVEVKITLTGNDPGDYTAELVTTVIRDPNYTEYNTLLAGYSWIDVPGKNVSIGDMIVVDIEGYGQAEITAPPKQFFMSVKNLTKNNEVFCTTAHPILAADISTLSFALRLSKYERHYRVDTPYRPGGTLNLDWCLLKFGVWIIHSGSSKQVLYPATMSQEWKDELAALAVMNGRTEINTLLLDTRWQYVPLAQPKDGWADTAINEYRDYWASIKHYWYNEPWVIDDPDVWFYESGYPGGGWVRYRATELGMPAGGMTTEFTLGELWAPEGGNSFNLMFCTNPRWGWNYYSGIVNMFIQMEASTTFFAHPNGSYAFWCDSLIFDGNGMPNFGSDSNYPVDVNNCESLSIWDATKVEHCIFDRIHLEVPSGVSKAAIADTTFLEMYNKAVKAGKDAKTLEANIDEMTLDDIRGVFTKMTNGYYYVTTGEYLEVLELKFTWRGKDWYFLEPGVQGNYVTDVPTILFPPQLCGNLIGVSLGHYWGQAPYNPDDPATLLYKVPIYVDMYNPSTLPIRFANPIIVMG